MPSAITAGQNGKSSIDFFARVYENGAKDNITAILTTI